MLAIAVDPFLHKLLDNFWRELIPTNGRSCDVKIPQIREALRSIHRSDPAVIARIEEWARVMRWFELL